MAHPDVIREFQGAYRFLSNFEPCRVYYRGVRYPTVEHAYQASKFRSKSARNEIRAAATPGKAKRLARQLVHEHPPREGNAWKLGVMRRLLRQKFDPDLNPRLHRLLRDTAGSRLEEGNTWGDTFWGVTKTTGGENHLGRLLMEVRG